MHCSKRNVPRASMPYICNRHVFLVFEAGLGRAEYAKSAVKPSAVIHFIDLVFKSKMLENHTYDSIRFDSNLSSKWVKYGGGLLGPFGKKEENKSKNGLP